MTHSPQGSPAGDWLASQRAANRSRFDAWDASAPHRARVTAEIARGFSPADEADLLLLGVGPAVDVDLPALLRTFSSIVAADFDGDTLGEALARQGVADEPGLSVAIGDDLLPGAEAPAASGLGDAYLGKLAAIPALPAIGGERFDAVASLSLLTQLIERVVQRVGPDHPRLPRFAEAVRAGHLRTLAGLLEPGGVGLLVTDLFSDATAPGLADVPPDDVPEFVVAEVGRGNVFHGVHPSTLLDTLRSDPVLAPRIGPTQLLKPWVWTTDRRAFAVTAVKFRLREDAA